MTRRVPASEEGQLQGALSSLGGIAGLIRSRSLHLTFAWFLGAARRIALPGAPLLLAALLMLVSLAVAWRATRAG